jgi:hypothetical protein
VFIEPSGLADRRVIHPFFSAPRPEKRDRITVKRSTLVRTRALKIPCPPTTV